MTESQAKKNISLLSPALTYDAVKDADIVRKSNEIGSFVLVQRAKYGESTISDENEYCSISIIKQYQQLICTSEMKI